MTETPAPAVLTELRDHVLVVTLNRPEARNAVNAELTQGARGRAGTGRT